MTDPRPSLPEEARSGRQGLTLLGRGSAAEAKRIATLLRGETVGGALLLTAAVLALVWANTPYPTPTQRCATTGSARRHSTSISPSARGLPTDSSPSSSSSPGWSSSASSSPATCAIPAEPPSRPGRGRRDGRSGPGLRRRQPRHRRRRAPRLGDPDRDRHRLRARGPRHHQHPPPDSAAHLPADSRRGRRPVRDHDHRGVLHRRTPRLGSRAAVVPCGSSRSWSSVGSAPGGCCYPWRRPPGRSSTPPGSTPRLPACSSGSLSRSSAARPPGDRTPAPGWRSTSSTASGPSPPASPSPSSPSSPRA